MTSLLAKDSAILAFLLLSDGAHAQTPPLVQINPSTRPGKDYNEDGISHQEPCGKAVFGPLNRPSLMSLAKKEREPMPLTPAQKSLLEDWLMKHGEDPQRCPAPAEGSIGETQEPVPLNPTQHPLLEKWSKGPVDLRKRKPPSARQINQNPKWSDDTWFEKRYGDPDYYSRVKGLN